MKTKGLIRRLAPTLILLAAGATASAAEPIWVPTWTASTAPAAKPEVIQNRTIRQIVHTSAGGKLVRVRVSNAYGAKPLHIDAVAIALRDKADAIRPGSSAEVRFQGARGVTIAPGAFVESDPLPFEVPAERDLAVSYFVAGPAEGTTLHLFQRNAAYFGVGDQTGAVSIAPAPAAPPPTQQETLWLDEVEVAGSKATTAVVAFGDSLTDQHPGLAPDSNATWPDFLYDRLRKSGVETVAVSNAGLGGDRLLHNSSLLPALGVAALARFDADVLAQPNVKAVIVALGDNDIGQVPHFAPPAEHVSAEEIERALAQLAARAHEKSVRIYVCTLTPFRGVTIPDFFSEEKEADRQAVNTWIRSSKLFDGVADLAKALEDPAHPGKISPLYDSGDHAHPNAAGDKAVAEAIPLAWFR